MSRSTHFFAMEPATRDLNSPEFEARAVSWLSQQNHEEEACIADLIRRVCAGDVPEECSMEWFEAMFCIAIANFEHIQFESLVALRSSDRIVEDVGLLLPCLDTLPRFLVPRTRQHYPCIGYVPFVELETFEYRVGGKVTAKKLAALETEVESLLQELGMAPAGKASRSKSRSAGDSSRIDGIRKDLDYLFETLHNDRLDLLCTFY